MSMYADRATEVNQPVREVAANTRDTAVDVAGSARDTAVEIARTASGDAGQVVQAVRDAGVGVAGVARDGASSVVDEAKGQARGLSADVRQRVRDEVDRQHQGVVDRASAFADELHAMSAQQPQTPAKELVGMLAARSSEFAQYLEQHGPEAVLAEVQAFARRRPATFVFAAVAAGFVAGRLAKGIWQNQHESSGS